MRLDGLEERVGGLERPRHALAGERLDVARGIADERDRASCCAARTPRHRSGGDEAMERRVQFRQKRRTMTKDRSNELLGRSPQAPVLAHEARGMHAFRCSIVDLANQAEVARRIDEHQHPVAAQAQRRRPCLGRLERGGEAEASAASPRGEPRATRDAASKTVRRDEQPARPASPLATVLDFNDRIAPGPAAIQLDQSRRGRTNAQRAGFDRRIPERRIERAARHEPAAVTRDGLEAKFEQAAAGGLLDREASRPSGGDRLDQRAKSTPLEQRQNAGIQAVSAALVPSRDAAIDDRRAKPPTREPHRGKASRGTASHDDRVEAFLHSRRHRVSCGLEHRTGG